MFGILRLLFGGLGRTALTLGTAGTVAHQVTGGKSTKAVFDTVSDNVSDFASSAADNLFKDFDPMKLLGDNWGKLGFAAAVAGVFTGSGLIRNLSIGVLLATAAYMAYKHFAGPKTDFNTAAPAVEGAASVATPTNLKLVEAPKAVTAPVADTTQTGFNRQTAAPQPLVRLNIAGGKDAKVEGDQPIITNE